MKRATHRVRAHIRHAAMTRAPLWLSGGRLARVRPEQTPIAMTRDIILPGLPRELDGLTITHLSDLHVGHLTTPGHLPAILKTAADAGGDLVAVTGDFVDLSLDVLDEVAAALARLSAPLGVFLVMGNHDHLVNGPRVRRRLRQAGLNLLVNRSVVLEHHGKRIAIAGIDYDKTRTGLAHLVRQTMARADAHGHVDLKILLAHHPDAFDQACRSGVDLTLSGHTHGGQLVLRHTRGKRGSIGLGAMAFRYPRGHYQSGPHHLHVTSGIGSWFPLRIRCPAEIVTLRLCSSQAASPPRREA